MRDEDQDRREPPRSAIEIAAADLAPAHGRQVLRQLLPRARALKDLRAGGYSHEQIHSLLEGDGIVCKAGTLREYIPRILRAFDELRARLNRDPTTEELRGALSRKAPPKRAGGMAGSSRGVPPAPVARASQRYAILDESKL